MSRQNCCLVSWNTCYATASLVPPLRPTLFLMQAENMQERFFKINIRPAPPPPAPRFVQHSCLCFFQNKSQVTITPPI